MRLFLWTIITLYCCASCSTDKNENTANDPSLSEEMYFPPNNSDEWETIEPMDLQWNTDKEQELISFLEEKHTKGFMILKNGRIVREWYFDDFKKNSLWYWASAGKTLTAFTLGIAQAQQYLSITDTTATYLGLGWTSLNADKEQKITLKHQLSMTSGLNYLEFDCTSPDCLTYVSDAGEKWSYHNGPYTLLQEVIANAVNDTFDHYFATQLKDKIGMDGFWFVSGQNHVYYSPLRSMARFGILNLNNGVWKNELLLEDTSYLNAMKNSSQDLNLSYGYLWWLNGKQSYRLPGIGNLHQGSLIPNAPSDMYAGLGKNDQKLYIIPSQQLVVVRMGEAADTSALSSSEFDNELWQKINAFIQNP